MNKIITKILIIVGIVLLIPLTLSVMALVSDIPQEIEEPAPIVEIDKILILAQAIQQFEGYYAGSLAQRNNNPGNLRYSPLQSGKRDGFAYFDTFEIGMEALKHQIRIGATGTSRVYRPDMTLLQFFNTYAPSSDNNQPSIYYQFVLDTTGFTSATTLQDLL
jgi:hypothetical protein